MAASEVQSGCPRHRRDGAGDFAAYARLHWAEIRQSLRDGSYCPAPVRRVVIPKPGGKGERLLGVRTVLDRVIQQAISQVLTPMFEPEFSEFSFGCRPKRSAHGAIKQVKEYVKQGYRVVEHSKTLSTVARVDFAAVASVDGISAEADQPLSAGLDGLLRDFPALMGQFPS